MAATEPELQLLEACYASALTQFLANDLRLLATVTHEQALAHRIAKYLEEKARGMGLDEHYVADCEYNRNGNMVKRIIDEKGEIISIRADIILHSRGLLTEQDNLIAIELKMLPEKEENLESDRIRLVAMTAQNSHDTYAWNGGELPKYVCGYKLGVYLLFDAKAGLIHQEFYGDEAFKGNGQTIDVHSQVEEIRTLSKQL